MVQQLMNAGADPNMQDRNGQSALHICAMNGGIECLAEIFNSKPKTLDFEVKNFDGLTALHVAVQKQHQSIVEALIQHGANINAKVGLLSRCLEH